MVITSYGYDGPITETPWSKMSIMSTTAQYSVGDAIENRTGHFRVTAVANSDRTVSVAAGEAYGCGVYDISDSAQTLTFDPVTTGSRYDLVVLRRDWSTNTTSLAVVKGSATTTTTYTTRNRTPGMLDDQPLALVRIDAGVSAVAAVYDVRCWASNGGVVGVHDHVRGYINRLGSTVRIGNKTWQLGLDITGATPTWYDFEGDPVRRGWFAYRGNEDAWSASTNGVMTSLTVPDSQAPAGTYLIHGWMQTRAASAPIAFLSRYVANGTLVTNREFRDDRISTSYTGVSSPAVPYYHNGSGALQVVYQGRCATTAYVSYAGLSVSYLGPAQG